MDVNDILDTLETSLFDDESLTLPEDEEFGE